MSRRDEPRTRVAVIFGGRSTEHDVSCRSAVSVLRFLDRARYEVVPIRISREGEWLVGADRPAAALDVSALEAMTPRDGLDRPSPADSLFAALEHLQTGRFVVTFVDDSLIGMSGRAPRPETSACLHDSGGPYFKTLPDGGAALVSVVSGGPACPHAGPDLNARVDNIADWISETTRDATGPFDGKLASAPIRVVLSVAVVALLLLAGALGWARRPHRRRRRDYREVTRSDRRPGVSA